MKTLLFTNLYPFAQAPTRGMHHVSVFGAISRHCEVRLVAPLPWWSRVRRPWEWITVPHETTTGIDASFPTYWSIPGRHELHGDAIYRSLRGYVEKFRRDFPFDVILAARAYPDAYAAAQLARDFGCPLVTNVLGSDVPADGHKPGAIAASLTPREWDQLVDVIVERLEDRISDELSRRGRRFNPGVM